MTNTLHVFILGYTSNDPAFVADNAIAQQVYDFDHPAGVETVLIRPTDYANLTQQLEELSARTGSDTEVNIYVSGHGQSEVAFDAQLASGETTDEYLQSRMDGIQLGSNIVPYNRLFSDMPRDFADSILINSCYSGSAMKHADHLPPGVSVYATGNEYAVSYGAENALFMHTDFLPILEAGELSPERWFIESNDIFLDHEESNFLFTNNFAVSGIGEVNLWDDLMGRTEPLSQEALELTRQQLEGDRSDQYARERVGINSEKDFVDYVYLRNDPLEQTALTSTTGETEEEVEDGRSRYFGPEKAAELVMYYNELMLSDPFWSSTREHGSTVLPQIYQGNLPGNIDLNTVQEILVESGHLEAPQAEWNNVSAQAYVDILRENNLAITTTSDEVVGFHNVSKAAQQAGEISSGFAVEQPSEQESQFGARPLDTTNNGHDGKVVESISY